MRWITAKPNKTEPSSGTTDVPAAKGIVVKPHPAHIQARATEDKRTLGSLFTDTLTRYNAVEPKVFKYEYAWLHSDDHVMVTIRKRQHQFVFSLSDAPIASGVAGTFQTLKIVFNSRLIKPGNPGWQNGIVNGVPGQYALYPQCLLILFLDLRVEENDTGLEAAVTFLLHVTGRVSNGGFDIRALAI